MQFAYVINEIPMWLLTRPVTADQTHHNTRNNEYAHDYDQCLDHAKVPCMCANASDITIALRNMPAMMYIKSMLIVYSGLPDRVLGVFWPLCIFFNMGVFYHQAGPFATMGRCQIKKNLPNKKCYATTIRKFSF